MHKNKERINRQRQTSYSRRSLLKGAVTGFTGLSLAGMTGAPIEEQVAFATQNVNRNSSPSELRITDLRVAVVSKAPMRCPLIRIDTNQDICGYGEVRDGASEKYALILKSRLLRQNPCNVEKIFKLIKQFGYHARQGGGVSGVEMALWDLAGKAYGVPVYQMLGGRYRDRVRLYADTPDGRLSPALRLKAGSKIGAGAIAAVSAGIVLALDENWFAFTALTITFVVLVGLSGLVLVRQRALVARWMAEEDERPVA